VQLLEKKSTSFLLRFSAEEVSMLCAALGHVANGLASPGDDYFVARLGVLPQELLSLRARLCGNPAPREPAIHNGGPTEASFTVDSEKGGTAMVETSSFNLHAMVRALNELVYGVSIPEWEFATIIGFERGELRELLDGLHRLLVAA
jgi:hypothetical protein